MVLRSLLALGAAGVWLLAGVGSAAADGGAWAGGPLPREAGGPVFALAVDPASPAHLLAGTDGGAVLASADGGATWRVARSGLGRGVEALAFDPAHAGAVLAGTRGAGVWRSADGGVTWLPEAGSEGRTVRALGFPGGGTALAGADDGLLASHDGGPWTPAALPGVRVSALAVSADLVVAGGDAMRGGAVPLFVSGDAGQTWSPVPAGPLVGSALVTALAPAAGERPLLMGTDAGLFASVDRGATWQQVTGAGVLPGTDFTAVGASPRHPELVYVASDGGGGNRGGLWASTDGGQHFSALAPPDGVVTALAVSGDDAPALVVATFRPSDHAVAVWTYRSGPAPAPTPSPSPSATPPAPAAHMPEVVAWRREALAALAAPETPYLAIAAACLLAVAAALASYTRRGRLR
jgi:hypothetical protein